METLQNLLTLAIEFVAIAGFGGIALHATWSGHRRWMNEFCPPVKPFEPAVVEPAVVEPAVVESAVVEPAVVEPAVVESAVEEPAVVEPAVVESAVEEPEVIEPAVVEPEVTEPIIAEPASKYEAMNVKSLRQECQIHCIDWKKGGDYGKPMRKNQMIRALTA